MTKYVLLYTGGGMPETEEEQAAVMAAWGAWYEGLGDAVVDPGNPLVPSAYIASDGSVSEASAGVPASGYTILSVGSKEAAISMAKKCPMLEGNGQITVCEVFEM